MKKLLSLLLLFVAIQLKAQTDPVQVTAQLLPPYSLIVSEYYAGTTPKINLLLLNRDLARPTITVRLRMTIESQSVKLRTKDLPATTLATFTLTAGVPVYVSNTDLTQYFNAANLDFNGISASEYQQSGKLPEGFYTFCFEAIEVQSSIAVSRSSCAFAWMTLSDPPLLNIPSCGEEVAPINPQNIVFNWTPRHMAAPNAAFLMEYQFSITEINDALPSPESAFFSGTPLYTGTTAATTFLYGPGMPQLQANKRYAWRVRAVAKQGSVEQAMFKNNGYSQVCWFTYRSNCDPVIGISATVQGTRATIEWQANTKHLEYKVQYRMVADSLGEWFTTSNTIPRVAIYDLKASKQYEYRVGASCEYGFFNYSEKKYFTTGDSSQTFVASCGIDGTPTSVAAGTPLATLAVNDTIRAGDFTIRVTEATGSNGNFSGKGYTSVPWLAGVKVGVEFTSITVNSDRKLTAGVIKTTYDPQWNGIFDVDGFLEGGGETGHVVTGLVTADYKPNVTITNPNQVVVTSGTNGSSTITINTPGGSATYTAPSLPATIQDNQGNIYTVNKPVPPSNEPTVTQSAQNGGQGVIGKMNPKQLDGSQGKVEFMPPADATKMTYAFDAWKDVYAKSTAFASKYERINGGSTPYYVAAKAIAPGKPDIIRAKVTLTDASLKADSVQFISGKGVIFTKTATGTAGEYNISLVGGPADDAQEIYACYKTAAGKTLNLGKLLVAGYGKKEYTVKLVPVNGALIDTQSIRIKLENIYSGINIKWVIQKDENFVDNSWDDGDKKLDIRTTGFLASYSTEMKNLIKAYERERTVNKNTTYLFVLDSAKSDETLPLAGDMPRNKQYGFIFAHNSGTALAKTVSHELGHGLFNLKHVFEYNGVAKSDMADNLLNYSNGESLTKYQWDIISDPPLAPGLFDNDSQGELVHSGTIMDPRFKNTSSNTYTFLTPGGTYLSLPDSVKAVTFASVISNMGVGNILDEKKFYTVPGCLIAFKLGDKTYEASIASDATVGGQFNGYTDAGGISLPDLFIKNVPLEHICTGVNTGEGLELVKFKINAHALSAYSNSNVVIPTDIQLYDKLKLYGSNPVVKTAEGIEIKTMIRAYTNTNYPGNTMEKYTEAHWGKNTILLGMRMGSMAYYYNDMFENGFSSAYESWNGQPNPYVSLPVFDTKVNANAQNLYDKYKATDKSAFYLAAIQEFITYCDEAADRFSTYMNSITDATKDWELMPVLKLGNKKMFEGIDIEKRVLAIKILANATYVDDNVEKYILRLMKEIDEQDLKIASTGILDALKGEGLTANSKLFIQLRDGIDDSFMGLGDDNYRAFINTIIYLCYHDESNFIRKVKDINPTNIQSKTVAFNDVGFWERIGLAVKQSFAGNVPYAGLKTTAPVTEATVSNDLKVSIKQNLVVGGVTCDAGNPAIVYDFLEPVILINNTNLAETNGLGYKQEEYDKQLAELKLAPNNPQMTSRMSFLPIPAIVATYLDKKATNQLITSAVITTLDIATIFTGIGPAFRAASAFRRAYAVADVAGSGFSITGGIVAEAGGDPDLVAFFNESSAVFGIFGIGNINAAKSAKISDILNNAEMGEEAFVKWSNVDAFASRIKQMKDKMPNFNAKYSSKLARQTEGAIDRLVVEATVAGKTDLVEKLVVAKKIMSEVQKPVGFLRMTGKWLNTTVSTGKQKLFAMLGKMEDEGRLIVREEGAVKKVYANVINNGTTEEKLLGKLSTDGNGLATDIIDVETPPSMINTTADNIVEVTEDGAWALLKKEGNVCLKEGGCLLPETMVHTAKGLLRADEIKKGMLVKAYDENRKDTVLGKVTEVFTRGIGKILRLFSGKEVIAITPNHPVYTRVNNQWRYMVSDSLVKGMVLLTLAGQVVPIDSIAAEMKPATVYNYEIDQYHNYYAGNTGWLVHNGAIGCFATRWPVIAGMPQEFFEYFTKAGKSDLIGVFNTIYSKTENAALLTKFANGTYSYKAWEILYENTKTVTGFSAHLSDAKNLETVSNIYKNELTKFNHAALNNNVFGSIATAEGRFKEFMRILNGNFACEACGNGNALAHRMPTLDKIWADTKFAIDNHLFNSYLTGGRAFSEITTTRYGYFWELTVGAENTVTSVGRGLKNGKLYDFLTDLGWLECKNVSRETIETIGKGTWDDFNQFLGYIGDDRTTSWGFIRYKFHPAAYGGSIDLMKTEVKKQFQKLFQIESKGNEVFEAIWGNAGVRNGFWPDLVGAPQANLDALKTLKKDGFITWVNTLDDKVFNFIK